jgi:hypothetical protein
MPLRGKHFMGLAFRVLGKDINYFEISKYFPEFISHILAEKTCGGR